MRVRLHASRTRRRNCLKCLNASDRSTRMSARDSDSCVTVGLNAEGTPLNVGLLHTTCKIVQTIHNQII